MQPRRFDKLATFFETIRSCFYDPAFYARARQEKAERGLWFLFRVNLLQVGLFAVFFLVILAPYATFDFIPKLADKYPADLVVQVAGGQLSINQPEPYIIQNPFDDKTGNK